MKDRIKEAEEAQPIKVKLNDLLTVDVYEDHAELRCQWIDISAFRKVLEENEKLNGQIHTTKKMEQFAWAFHEWAKTNVANYRFKDSAMGAFIEQFNYDYHD